MVKTAADLIGELTAQQLLKQRWAIEELGRRGDDAAEAVPALIGLLSHPEWRTRELVVGVLGRLGGVALSSLQSALSSDDEYTRIGASKAIGLMGPAAAVAVQELVVALGDPSPAVRSAAASALGAIGSDAAEGVAPLVKLLRERRVSAPVVSRALGGIGQPAVSTLLELLDEDDLVAAAAAEALGMLRSPDKAVVQALAGKTLACGALRHSALEALSSFGSLAADAIPVLEQKIAVASPDARGGLYALLGDIGTVEAAEILVQWIEEEEDRAPIAEALRKMGRPEAVCAVPCLIDLLDNADEDDETRSRAVHALGNVGETDGRVHLALARALEDPESKVSDSAIHALGKLHSEQAATVLARLLPSTDGVRLSRVLSALGECGRVGGVAVPAICQLLRASNDQAQTRNALEALAQVGAAAEEAIPDLIEVLFSSESEGWIPSTAAAALGAIGAAAVAPCLDAWEQRRPPRRLSVDGLLEKFGTEAVPALVEALERESPGLRAAVARQLGAYPSFSNTIGPALFRIVREDAEDRVRDAAAVALGRLGWHASATETPQPAEHLDLLEKVGEGATGTVWLAQDTQLGRRVAVKIFKPAGMGSHDWLEQGRALARVSHPNVNRVHAAYHLVDPERNAIAPALVLEYIDGKSLETVLKADLRPQQLRALGLQILDGLHALHAAGVYHLDLHEENVMVNDEEQALLIDINYLTSLSEISVRLRASRDRMEFNAVYCLLERLLRRAGVPRERRGTLADFHADEVYDLDRIRASFDAAFVAD